MLKTDLRTVQVVCGASCGMLKQEDCKFFKESPNKQCKHLSVNKVSCLYCEWTGDTFDFSYANAELNEVVEAH